MFTDAIAGPSSRPYFPPPFRVDDFFPPTGSANSSRSSTPAFQPKRARSITTVSAITDKRRNEIINKHRHEAAQRLKTAWERLLEKYGHIGPEEDDEVDLVTGKVTKYRGGLLEFREEGGELPGDDSEDDEETETGSMAQFESDEDELGQWDGRSGLDDQGLEEAREQDKTMVRPWNSEDPFDQLDKDEFLRLEALQRQRMREERMRMGLPISGGDHEFAEDVVDWSGDDEEMDSGPTSDGSEVEEVETIEQGPLYGADSDDEILAQTSEAEEATRVVYVDEMDGSHRASTNGLTLHDVLADSHEESVATENAGPRIFAPLPRRPLFRESVFEKTEQIRPKTPPKRIHDDSPPPSDLDTEAYYTHTARWRNNITLRKCKHCLAAGGIRAERAKWCKGRRIDAFCSFLSPEPWSENEGDSREGSVDIVRRKRYTIKVPEYRAPRKCRRCVKAGGLRSQRAMFCKGRRSVNNCPYDLDASDSDVAPLPPTKAPFKATAPIPDVNPLTLDPRRYFTDLKYTHNGARLRSCTRCKWTGGIRAIRSPWCRGRRIDAYCTFTTDLTDDDDSDEGLEAGSGDDASRGEETITLAHIMEMDRLAQLAHRAERSSLSGSQPVEQSIKSDFTTFEPSNRKEYLDQILPNGRPAGLDPTRYAERLAYANAQSKIPRFCKHCQKAGGRRAEVSFWCNGRIRAKNCVFFQEGDDGEWHPRSERDGSGTTKPTLESVITIPMKEGLDKWVSGRPLEGFYADKRYDAKGELIMCQKCHEKDGKRRDMAPWCKGRRHPGLCGFAARDAAEGDGEESVQPNAPVSLPTPRPRAPQQESLTLAAIEAQQNLPSPPPEEQSVRVTGQDDTGNDNDQGVQHLGFIPSQHGDVDAEDDAAAEGLESLFKDLDSDCDSFGPTPEELEPVELGAEEIEQILRPMLPSSPPPSPPLPAHDSPTPSPVPEIDMEPQLPAHRPAQAMDIAPHPVSSPRGPTPTNLRMATFPFRPTPPSSTGARSSSVSSDRIPLSAPRGIMRRPSEFGTPLSQRSAKRTRFSLAPTSPPRHFQSDPILPMDAVVDSDDDELLLGPATSPAYPTQVFANRSERAQTIGAMPSTLTFSQDVSMRAKDLGFDLSQHSGRLSSNMLAALTPALQSKSEASLITLASSLRQNQGEQITGAGEYSLPTPPPSHTSRTSDTQASSVPKVSSDGSLMLPPPVPARTTVSRLPTPVSGEGEDSDQGIVTPKQTFKKLRAKSTGALPRAGRRYSSPIRTPSVNRKPKIHAHPSSTPRKKSKLEETLEMEAELVEDESFEWGMDEEVGEDLGRLWRAGSVFRYVD